jgi:hypothetical protein
MTGEGRRGSPAGQSDDRETVATGERRRVDRRDRQHTGDRSGRRRLAAAGEHHAQDGLTGMAPRCDSLGDQRTPLVDVERYVECTRGAGEAGEVRLEVIDPRAPIGIGDEPGRLEAAVPSGQTQIVGSENGTIGIAHDPRPEHRRQPGSSFVDHTTIVDRRAGPRAARCASACTRDDRKHTSLPTRGVCLTSHLA